MTDIKTLWRLTRAIGNPQKDLRRRGRLFQAELPEGLEFVRIQYEDTVAYQLYGSSSYTGRVYPHEDLGKLLLINLEQVEPTLEQWVHLNVEFANTVLEQLLADGAVTREQVLAAQEAYDDAHDPR